jgi:hypothetical protein
MIKILNKNFIILKMILLLGINVKVIHKKAIQYYYLINKVQNKYEKETFLKDSSKIILI